MLTAPTPKQRISPERKSLIDEHRELLNALWQTYLDLGRRPTIQEFDFAHDVGKLFGSFSKSLDFIEDTYDNSQIEMAVAQRRDDLLLYFALNLFERRKLYTRLPDGLKRDIKKFFGDYKSALEEGSGILFSVGNTDTIQASAYEAAEKLSLRIPRG